jgi:hypothetical protein
MRVNEVAGIMCKGPTAATGTGLRAANLITASFRGGPLQEGH